MKTTIQVRTKREIKKATERILEKLGLNLSTAINLYLVQIIEKQGIPFAVVTENGFTPVEEEEMLKELVWARKHGKRYTSAKTLHDDVLKE
jgi:DNA-damage-inducible protein J